MLAISKEDAGLAAAIIGAVTALLGLVTVLVKLWLEKPSPTVEKVVGDLAKPVAAAGEAATSPEAVAFLASAWALKNHGPQAAGIVIESFDAVLKANPTVAAGPAG